MYKNIFGWMLIVVLMAFYFIVGQVMLRSLEVVYFWVFTLVLAVILTVYMLKAKDENKEVTTEGEDTKIE
jgi:ABC-type branched-subunit amino acid transport system permease subunit